MGTSSHFWSKFGHECCCYKSEVLFLWMDWSKNIYQRNQSVNQSIYDSFCVDRWLDRLGLSAVNGVDVVIRQSFYKGNYAMIDRLDYTPFPVSSLSFSTTEETMLMVDYLDYTPCPVSSRIFKGALCSNRPSVLYTIPSICLFIYSLRLNMGFPLPGFYLVSSHFIAVHCHIN